MIKVDIYNVKGEKVGQEELNEVVFNVEVKPVVIHQVLVAQEANSRQVVAHTKTKGEVRGGGRKPWKQKGTGRARVGSTRSPLWRGGGVVFGPRNDRNFSKQVNKKMKTKALRMILSDKAVTGHIILLDSLAFDKPKTAAVVELIQKLPVAKASVLVSLAKKDEAFLRAVRNVPQAGYIAADSLNVADVLRYEYVLLDKAALEKITAVFGQ